MLHGHPRSEAKKTTMPLFVKVLASIAVGLGVLHAVIKKNQQQIDRYVMGIVRDVGRYKAKRRRMGNSKGITLMSTLLHKDDPMEDLDFLAGAGGDEMEDESDLPAYTAQELLEYGDGREDRPILIGIFGRVYDVSEGEKFYGEGGPYEAFAGRDVTYSLSTGCRTEECMKKTADALEDRELGEGKRWLSFFHLHDKYPLVGKLEGNYLEMLLEDLLVKDDSLIDEDGNVVAPLA